MSGDYLAQLIQKYATGKASEEEKQELLNYYRSASFDEVQWPGERTEVYNRMLQRLHRKKTLTKGRLISSSWIKVAAVFFVMIGAGYLIVNLAKTSEEIITVTNPAGKIRLVHLPDNSNVWLNAASELRYAKRFTKQRNIELKGEAYFEVRHDPEHPFTVTAGDLQTEVLGTSFNIKAYPAEGLTTVSLVTGRVEVSERSKRLAVLQPSMQLQFDKQTHTISTLTLDTNSILAWKKGILQFEGESIGSIAGSLERWYGVQFHFTDPALRNCRYYLSVANTTSLDKMLALLTRLTGMQYATDTNKKIIIVSGKACP